MPDPLTRVDLPPIPPPADAAEIVRIADWDVPVFRCAALVLGSGAAGWRAAVELKRRGVEVLVATMSPYGGTSACSGSDKQTLHTAGTAHHGDDFLALARDLGAGGAMDQDQAYVEAVGSIGAMASLQYLGLPLPTDRHGAVLRYQTDHDAVGRATSCGPRTSRLMVKVLAEEALRLGVAVRGRCEAVELLVVDGRCRGVVAIDRDTRANPCGVCLVLADATLLATGGPGELYRDSVYPRHCYGGLGMALAAGAEVVNLTECQFGLGTRRQDFPWNLSGTYLQAIPRIFSRDAAGVEREFLGDWYRSTRELAANTFRKGYQWPFHASRMLGFGSSLVDLAVFAETRQGRTVHLDFLRNPAPVPGGAPFSVDDLDDDARAYLAANDARQATPLERLRRMNPLAIALFRMHGHDLERDPLPCNVNHQHLNGGVAVDTWGRSSIPGLYAIGEVAGTHGVTRPGGAALNAGQVGGMRAATHIAAGAVARTAAPVCEAMRTQTAEVIACARRDLAAPDAVAAVRTEIQARMSDQAGFICPLAEVAGARAAATALRRRLERDGLGTASAAHVADAFRWRHLALLAEAVLTALDAYIADGGGSRGARALCGADGTELPQARDRDLAGYRFRREDPRHRAERTVLRREGEALRLERRGLRLIEDTGGIVFERNWGHFLSGAVYQDGFRHH